MCVVGEPRRRENREKCQALNIVLIANGVLCPIAFPFGHAGVLTAGTAFLCDYGCVAPIPFLLLLHINIRCVPCVHRFAEHFREYECRSKPESVSAPNRRIFGGGADPENRVFAERAGVPSLFF